MFSEHIRLESTCGFEKSVNTSHDVRPSVSFSLLQDSKKRSSHGGVGVGVVSFLDADFHRGDGIVRVRCSSAVTFAVALRVELQHSVDLELPSDWLYPNPDDNALSGSEMVA